jgi:putative inorganic carbon (HCO3(-)) transporter
LGIMLALGLGFLMIAPIYGNPTINRIRSAFDFDDEASLNVRDVNRKSVQPYMLTHPFGGGLGTTGGSGTKYNPGHPLAGFATDSGFLQTSAELGFLALLMLLIQYYVIIRTGLTMYFSEINKSIKILIAASLVCVFTFVIAQYAQVAVGQFPDSFLFMAAVAIIAKTSINISQNRTI